MILRITLLWLIGMVTIVPYAIYQLLFHATKDQYAFLIVIPFAWIFGFWGIVTPAIMAWKTWRIMYALDKATSAETRRRILESPEAEDVVIGAIAAENRIPTFLARIIYKKVKERFQEADTGNKPEGGEASP